MVHLYLVQHGIALAEREDPDRPLSRTGRAEVAAVARRAAAAGVTFGAIRHSGKLRARQTAEILADCIAHTGAPDERPGLGPKDDPAPLASELATVDLPLTLVGHLPQLSRLSSLLLCGDPERELLAFRNGALVRLSRHERRWSLVWVLTPELALP